MNYNPTSRSASSHLCWAGCTSRITLIVSTVLGHGTYILPGRCFASSVEVSTYHSFTALSTRTVDVLFVWQAVQAELQDKQYEGEEAKEWSLNIADTIREGVKTLNVPRQVFFFFFSILRRIGKHEH